ncbi:MAG TPA: hypothetical protein VGV89_03780 [Thermoplasmata archaeon]|nr:hypothetical protein [Thermoplasmata archaeon]
MASPPVHSRAPSTPADDPGLAVWRDHTFLQMLAEGFRFVAKIVRSGDPLDLGRLSEGVAIHRAFVVDLHQRRLAVFERVLGGLAGNPYANGIEECHRAQASAERASAELEDEVQRLKSGDSGMREALSARLEHEAQRWSVHFHREADELFPGLDRRSGEERRALATGLTPIWNGSAAVEERLTSWTSRLGPSSD